MVKVPRQDSDESSKVAPPGNDSEKQTSDNNQRKSSVYKGLGWLDRLLVLWILLAMVIGILLGNFVDSVGPALQKGKFVGVSIPIGRVLVRVFYGLLTWTKRWGFLS